MSEVALSVIVPCFDLERFVAECLDSLAPIGRTGGELVVVDDGSRDRSRPIVEEWVAEYDGRCRTVFHGTNRGAPAAFNSGLAAASEPLVCFVDGDDLAEPDALARQARMLADAPGEVVAVFGEVELVDETGRPLSGDPVDEIVAESGEPMAGDVRAALVARGSVFPLLGTVVRTADVRRVGGFDETLRFCDWPLWLKLAPRGRFVGSGEVVGRYRQHPASMSRRRRDDLDRDRLRLLAGLARDRDYADLRPEIAARSGRLVATMAHRGVRPRLTTGLSAAWALRSPRLAARVGLAQVVRAGLPRSPVSTVPTAAVGRDSSCSAGPS